MGKLAERLKQLPQGQRIYRLQVLATLLAESSQVDRLHTLLTDFDFIEAKVFELGSQPLIEDYDLAFNSELLTSAQGLKQNTDNLKLIQGALQRSAHILNQDKIQLAGQLLGRLLSGNAPKIQPILEQAKQWNAAPWFRPLTPSLTQPTEPLLRTLVGHQSGVNAVTVLPDGQQAISASDDGTLKLWNLNTGEAVRTLVGHTKPVLAVTVLPDAQQAISASDDATMKLWDLNTG